MTWPAPLCASLQHTLAELRAHRRFDLDACLAEKARRLRHYLESAGLRACVVGVSGGVDSAVVLGLLARVKALPRSPLRRLVAVLAPIAGEGASNQATALARGREVAAAAGAECAEVDLGSSFATLRAASEQGLGMRGDAWAAGQLASYLRTPAFYYATAVLTAHGFPAVLCGTTNRDEGSYLGFFGKASDGMVDLQPISDLHKSEVYALAERLGVPASVRAAIPSGDTFDGRVDEEMIGAPYDFVELYTGLLALAEEAPAAASAHQAAWDEAGRRQFAHYAAAVEELHRKNLHKYEGGSPAIHFDVYPRAVPGGWRA